MSAQARRLVSGGSKESKCGVSAAQGTSATQLHVPVTFYKGEKQTETVKVSAEEMGLGRAGAVAFIMCRNQPQEARQAQPPNCHCPQNSPSHGCAEATFGWQPIEGCRRCVTADIFTLPRRPSHIRQPSNGCPGGDLRCGHDEESR
jgi:hypothetical protein